MITVTKTFLPPLDEYKSHLERVWKNAWLTNRGELVLLLEEKLKSFLKVNNITITNNGTIPLQIALKIFGNKGEIITTPFSYVATTSSIIWENCTPVFVDIHPDFFTIDEKKIEEKITNKTTAILATHVFGNPCNVEFIERIAKKYNLKVIYDGAHCFGVQYKNQSIFNYGDVSTCSFHATKLFHTAEGGAFFSQDIEVQHKMFYSHNFGHNGPLEFHGVGINGKISELQAALGLAILPYLDKILGDRKIIVNLYNSNLNMNKLKTLTIRENTIWNYSYYPIVFETEAILLEVQKILNENEIFPRRYFFPSLNTISYVNGVEMPISESIASRIVCLPLYSGLTNDEVHTIVSIINSNI